MKNSINKKNKKLEPVISHEGVAMCGAPPSSCSSCIDGVCKPKCVKDIIRRRKWRKILHPIKSYKENKRVDAAIKSVKKNIEDGFKKIKDKDKENKIK